jgi:hypothetical protein
MSSIRCSRYGAIAALWLLLTGGSALAKHPGPCVELWKDPAQGAVSYFYVFSYDANHRKASRAEYTPGASAPETVTRYTYDTGGRLLTEAVLDGGSGVPVSITHYTYNPDGTLRATLIDSRAVGRIDEIIVHSYAPDRSSRTDLIDYGPDGTIDLRQVHSFTYDDRGNVMVERIQDLDASGGTISTNLEIYSYDGDGNPTQVAIDRGADGSIDAEIVYQYTCW